MNAFCSGFCYFCSQKQETVCDPPEMSSGPLFGVATHRLGAAALDYTGVMEIGR